MRADGRGELVQSKESNNLKFDSQSAQVMLNNPSLLMKKFVINS